MKKIQLLMLILSAPIWAGYTYTITDGMDFGALTLTGTQSLLMTGGGGILLDVYFNSYARIERTAPYNQQIYPSGGIERLSVDDHAHLDFAGGEVYQIGVGNYATATISGGKITRLATAQTAWKWVGERDGHWEPNPHVEIICREYAYNTTTKKLTGLWNSDADNNRLYDPFNIQLVDVAGYSPTIDNIKFTIIPEPMTLALLALGGVLIRKK